MGKQIGNEYAPDDSEAWTAPQPACWTVEYPYGTGCSNGNEGFLFFSYYWNSWANPNESDATASCALEAARFKQDTWSAVDTKLSLPNSDKDNDIVDIGGLKTFNDWPYNVCGVITSGFEKKFNVF